MTLYDLGNMEATTVVLHVHGELRVEGVLTKVGSSYDAVVAGVQCRDSWAGVRSPVVCIR
jgi:hypothetical protein